MRCTRGQRLELEQFVLPDVVVSSDPAASAVVHLLIFCKCKKLLELILRADRGESHGAKSPSSSYALVRLVWGLWRGYTVCFTDLILFDEQSFSQRIVLFVLEPLDVSPEILSVDPRGD